MLNVTIIWHIAKVALSKFEFNYLNLFLMQFVIRKKILIFFMKIGVICSSSNLSRR